MPTKPTRSPGPPGVMQLGLKPPSPISHLQADQLPLALGCRSEAPDNGGQIFRFDADHAYSPATGQGMNSGLQDAVNPGWKLAFAAAATDRAALLDSYDLERR